MSTVIAVVTQVTGQVWARGVDGSMRAIEVGEALLQGETLITEAGANVVLDFGNGELFQLAGEQSLLMTPNVSAGTEPQVTESMLMDPSVADVLAALEGEGDLLEELEAPAAGTDGAPDGGGSSFVRLTRISESVDPLAYSFDPTSEPGFEAPIGEGGALDELSPPVVATISLTLIELDEDGIPLLNESGGFILVDGDSVIEGTPVGVLASVDIPPSGSPLVIQLGDGLGEIIIPVGGTSGFTPIEIRPDDVYIQDDDLIGVVIESATGGGYDQINTSAESDLVVVDDEDTVTVSITSDGDVTEAEPIAFTVSVSEALDRDLTVTLSTGDQVVIPAGATSVGYSLPAQGDDVYVDPSEVTVGLTAASVEGAEFEDLVLGGPATVQISDTLDTVTATLTASTSEISEMGGSITYTITLSGGPGLIAPMDDLVFGLANGESITIYQGQTSGSYTRVYTEGDILGEPNITNSIESIVSGGDEYEDLKTKGTTQVGIDYGVIITGIGAENGDHLLYESSLKTGTSPNNSALSEQGSFTITALDGISELSIGDTLLTYDQLENLTDSNVVITTSYGTLTLNGYTGSESGGVVSYVYKLDEKVDNDSQLGATNTSYLDSFSVTVTDTDGDSSSANIRIKIVDDEPVLDIRNGFLANESGGILIGTLVNMGADVGSSSGATTTSSITWDGTVIAKIITGSGVETGVTLTSLGETVVITVSGNEITGKTATTNQTVFTITGQMDGTYTVNLVRPLDSSKLFQADGEILTYGDGPKAGYVLYEGNNLVAATGISAEDPNVLATFRATSGGNAANVNMSSNGLAVGANVIQSGDRVYIDVNDNKQFSALFLSLNQQYKSGNGKYIVHYTDGTHSGEQVIQTTNSSNDFFIQAKAGTFIDSVEIIGVSGNWKIDGLNFFTLDVDRTPSLDLAFTAEDSDGDTVSGQVVLTFDTSPTLVEGSLNNDAIGGGSGDNTLMGGEGDDILVGGAGNDTLWGGEGDDVFVWNLGDQGEAGSPAYDVVKDFGLGNNKLDLSDLLQDETVATLSDYLSFTVTAEGTLISVNHTGGVSGVTQEIFLEGIDLAQMAIDSGVSGADAQEQIISYLLDSGKLEIDQ